MRGQAWLSRVVQLGPGRTRLSDVRESDAARAHGPTWLGSLPPLTSVPTRWRCKRGHVWTTLLNTVARGHRCPHCTGHARKTAADYRALARTRAFRWRGPTLPPNTATKTLWECSLGHRWSQRYSALQ